MVSYILNKYNVYSLYSQLVQMTHNKSIKYHHRMIYLFLISYKTNYVYFSNYFKNFTESA